MCDELGFDGIMLNEHHNAPFCMQATWQTRPVISAAIIVVPEPLNGS
jgi:hypothetical protein